MGERLGDGGEASAERLVLVCSVVRCRSGDVPGRHCTGKRRKGGWDAAVEADGLYLAW